MDKIRLSLISAAGNDFARLYNVDQGFGGRTDAIQLPQSETLVLLLNAARAYGVSVSGALLLAPQCDFGSKTCRMYEVCWAESAGADATGELRLENPDRPGEPYIFTLTRSEAFRFVPSPHLPTGAPTGPQTSGAREIILQEVLREHYRAM